MQFDTSTNLARCSGNNHYTLTLTVNSVPRVLSFTLQELQGEPPNNIEEARLDILARLRSAAKEANAATFLQLQTALQGKSFKV